MYFFYMNKIISILLLYHKSNERRKSSQRNCPTESHHNSLSLARQGKELGVQTTSIYLTWSRATRSQYQISFFCKVSIRWISFANQMWFFRIRHVIMNQVGKYTFLIVQRKKLSFFRFERARARQRQRGATASFCMLSRVYNHVGCKLVLCNTFWCWMYSFVTWCCWRTIKSCTFNCLLENQQISTFLRYLGMQWCVKMMNI